MSEIVQILPNTRLTVRSLIKGAVVGVIAGTLIGWATVPTPDLTHDQAQQEVLNALEIEYIQSRPSDTVLVGFGCGSSGETVMIAFEEDQFPYSCDAIEVYETSTGQPVDGPMMHGDHPTDHADLG